MKRTCTVALSLASLGFPLLASADSFEKKCPEVRECAQAVSELTGQRYVFDNDVKGTMHSTKNVELTTENAELLFTSMLNANGFTRIPLGTTGTFQIVRQRDGRDLALPFTRCDRRQAPILPTTWDLITMEYTPGHPELVEDMARTLRSFMPAASRIIPAKKTGQLYVTDTALNLAKTYQLLQELDSGSAKGGKR